MGQGIKGQAERLPAFSFVCNKGGKGLNAEPSLPAKHWSAEKAADRCSRGVPVMCASKGLPTSAVFKDRRMQKRRGATFISKRIDSCMRFLKSIFSHQIKRKKRK